MASLENSRHEAFAQALAKGKSAYEAYTQAGYTANRKNAWRLKTNEDVRGRVSELTGNAADKAEWTAADRLKSLKLIHDAQLKKDPRTAIAAISEANKMQGSHAPSKHQHSGPNGGPIPTVDLTNVSSDDLDRLEALFGPLAGATGDDAEADQAGEGEASV
jgi:phage terminase small subunit